MPGHDIIVIGASAGGVETLRTLVRGLPADLPAAVFVVLHFPADSRSALPQILTRSGPLSAAHAADGERIAPGRIYVAPPDSHMLVRRDRVELSHGPAENRHRPAVDPLFRSAAGAYGPRVVGVVLSGALDDGTDGMRAIKRRGGIAVVQDPADALFSGMPASALALAEVDYSAPVAEIPRLLARLASEPVPDVAPEDTLDEQTIEGNAAEAKMTYPEDDETTRGTPSVLSCPDCHGTLWELQEGGSLRFRCRVGHAWSAESMVATHDESAERALWAALRALEENAALSRRMADRARGRGSERVAARFEARAADAGHNAALLRDLLMKRTSAHDEGGSAEEKAQ